MKAFADKFALIDHPISDDDLILYVLNELGYDFREIAVLIRARETSLFFEALHDILVNHENYLRRLETTTQQLVASTNYSHRTKHGFSGGSHTKGSNKPSGSSRSQGQTRNSQGHSKDNRRSSSNNQRPNQWRYTPKCQFCEEMGPVLSIAHESINLV